MVSQKGNILFLILIAVALFAALSYAITKSSQGGGNIESEKGALSASSVFQYGTSVATAVMRMSIHGVQETEYCFYTGSNHTDYNHAGCSDDAHNVFHADGGGASYQDPPSGANDGTAWEFTGTTAVMGQGSWGGGDELVMVLRGMNREVCQGINDKIGVSGIPIDNGALDLNRFAGSYPGTDGIDGCPANCASVAVSPFGSIGTHIGCFEEEDTNDYIYFHTLLVR